MSTIARSLAHRNVVLRDWIANERLPHDRRQVEIQNVVSSNGHAHHLRFTKQRAESSFFVLTYRTAIFKAEEKYLRAKHPHSTWFLMCVTGQTFETRDAVSSNVMSTHMPIASKCRAGTIPVLSSVIAS